MMRVSISREFTDTEGVLDAENWEIEVDTPYNPDVVEDLVRRVSSLRDQDRRAMYASIKEDKEKEEQE